MLTLGSAQRRNSRPHGRGRWNDRRRTVRASGIVRSALDDVIVSARRIASAEKLVLDDAATGPTSLAFRRPRGVLASTTIVIDFEEIEPGSTRVSVLARTGGPGRRERCRQLADRILDGLHASRPLRLTY